MEHGVEKKQSALDKGDHGHRQEVDKSEMSNDQEKSMERSGVCEEDEMTEDRQGDSHLSEEASSLVEQMEAQLASKEEELIKINDKYVRSLAEIENMRRRNDREKADLLKFGNEKVMKDLLAVLDSFDKASSDSLGLENESKEIKSYVEGVQMVKKLLVSTLEKHGLKSVEIEGNFDPNIHQAISRIESSSVEKDTIKEVFGKGYTLNERLLRPAMVSVEVPTGNQDN